MDSSDDLQLFPMKKAAVALWVGQKGNSGPQLAWNDTERGGLR